jgi:uncharacterized protein
MVDDSPQTPAPLPTRRRFLSRGLAACGMLGVGTLGYAWRIEPHWVEIVRRPLPVVHLPQPLVGRRLVQISDLHVGPVVDDHYLRTSLESIAELEPDLIVVTGDVMTSVETEEVWHAAEVVRALPPAPLGRLAILGNHDYGNHFRCNQAANLLTDALERLDVRVLRNEVATPGGLPIAGIDDLATRHFDPARAFRELPTDRGAVTLCHNPDAVDLPVFREYHGWILAGHTHGGQCKLPWLPPPRLPVRNRRYTSGEFALGGGRRMYINRALGYVERIRFNCRPEITVFELVRDEASLA